MLQGSRSLTLVLVLTIKPKTAHFTFKSLPESWNFLHKTINIISIPYQTIVEAEAPVERCLHPLEVLEELLLRAAGHGDTDDGALPAWTSYGRYRQFTNHLQTIHDSHRQNSDHT